MEVATHQRITVADRTAVSAARAAAQDAALASGLLADDQHRAGLAATELATNLLKHAQRGELLIRQNPADGGCYVELIAIDRGPGMDVDRALVDGFSTAGSAGTGLGAVRRLSSQFDVVSGPDGSVVLAHVARTEGPATDASPRPFDIGGVSVPKDGEVLCGDRWAWHASDAAVSIIVADGLGHGPGAEEAARAAIAISPRVHGSPPCSEWLERIHEGTRHTRGLAAGVALIRSGGPSFVFAGVGNVGGMVVSPASHRQVVSNAGTLGHQARLFREYTYPWTPDSMLVIHSDGLSSHWSVPPRLRMHHPAVLAALLYRDHSRQRDDVTVVVVKEAA